MHDNRHPLAAADAMHSAFNRLCKQSDEGTTSTNTTAITISSTPIKLQSSSIIATLPDHQITNAAEMIQPKIAQTKQSSSPPPTLLLPSDTATNIDEIDEIEMIDDSEDDTTLKLNGSTVETNTFAEQTMAPASSTIRNKAEQQQTLENSSVEAIDKIVETVVATTETESQDEVALSIKGQQPTSPKHTAEIVVTSDGTVTEEQTNGDLDEPSSEISAAVPPIATDVATAAFVPLLQNNKETIDDESAQNAAKMTATTATSASTTITTNKQSSSRKRRTVSVSSEEMPPSKRLCAELEDNFGAHDRLLRDYIDKTANNNFDDLQRHLDQLSNDILNLNELAYAKEMEWNNILHLKKVKEEIVLRLSRRKTVMNIMATKVGEVDATVTADQSPLSTTLTKRITKELQQSFLASNNNNNISSNSLNNSSTVSMMPVLSSSTPISAAAAATGASIPVGGSAAQSILHSRANMKSADLAKEKEYTQKLHRLVCINVGIFI